MLKVSKGNMYDWVSHMHSHLGGKCPHECSYCYVQRNRFGVSPRYQGAIRLINNELNVCYGEGKIIFIEHMNDLFANLVPSAYILKILKHCKDYPKNKYVFQTKNPSKAFDFIDAFPPVFMFGTTIESDLPYPELGKAPDPVSRFLGMMLFKNWSRIGRKDLETFVTIEPILDFDVDGLVEMLKVLKPTFINIGADSKGCNLPEPSNENVKNWLTVYKKKGLL